MLSTEMLEKTNKIISNLEDQHRNFTIALIYVSRHPERSLEEILQSLSDHGYECEIGSNYLNDAFQIIDDIERTRN